MIKICLCFDVHIPIYFRNYKLFDIGKNSDYFDQDKIREDVIRKVENAFLPMNDLLNSFILNHPERFKVSFYISGITLELFERYCPHVIDSFKNLSDLGAVEFLSGSFHNSSRFLVTNLEYQNQLKRHSDKIKLHFNEMPSFRKDEVFTLRNQDLSFLIENFADKSSDIWPLTSVKFIDKLREENSSKIIIYLDYDLFGDRISENDGILNFTKSLFENVLFDPHIEFAHPNDIALSSSISQSNEMTDLENVLIKDFADEFTDIRSKLISGNDIDILSELDNLTSLDHIKRINEEPYEYYLTYSNVLSDIKRRAVEKKINSNSLPSERNTSNLRDIKGVVL